MLTPHLAFDSSLLNLSDILPGQPIRRETFEELRHMGYGAIEWHPHHKVWADRWYGKSAIEAAQLAHEAGLRSASVIARPVDACPGLGSAAESTLIDDLNLAKQLDARVAVVSLRGLDRWFKEAGERVAAVQIAETWRAAAREAGTRGLMLVWSLRPATMLDAPELLLQILDHVNIPNFGIEFDLADAGQYGASALPDCPEQASTLVALSLHDRLKGQVATIRLSDMARETHLPRDLAAVMRRLPGQGDLDWSRIVPALLDAWIPGLSWTVEPKTRTEAEAMAAFFVDRVEQHFSETATFLNR